ncbi:hypothetical protein [Mucilaginibacter psychrotolerans]|uniref:Uncharacterized protein n=1 Tax=Mucilaginibacter psychrotolerans TaxID=1524096 RepID=A0A4Y8SCN4_9SPHI|nr:hypothetical protein [Mucilaginibacter psychrotolerans]TFF36194.1 hypothetical protein E2R66_16770 [Mucilaginibacter psychrotolerans]
MSIGKSKLHSSLNYFGQLRMYSYVDIILMMVAFRADTMMIVSCSFMWFGFLIHLEWQHRDRGRLVWPVWAWIIPWIAGIIIHPSAFQIPIIATCAAYSLKKRYRWIGLISWIINGGIKAWMVAMIPAPLWGIYLVGGLMCLRNLAGDMRDGGKDSAEKVFTLPVALGLKKNIPFLYPSCLVATSIIWVCIGGISFLWLVPVFFIQSLTYNLTPR